MALITDPDQLNDGSVDNGSTEVYINTSSKTIKLNETGNLSADGVTIKAVYSFLKEEWKNDPNTKNLAAFPFPFNPITDEFFELVDGWNWSGTTTRNLLRRGGFLVRNTSGNVTEHWAGIAILGAQSDDQIYYDTGAGATNFVYLGNTSEVVQIISDPNGDGSYADGYDRSSNLKAYNREQGQVFSSGSTQANGEANLTAPKLFSITLNTGTDLKIVVADTGIKASGSGYPADVAPYSGMSITYHATPQSISGLSGGSYNFGVTIDGNGQTLQKVYEFVQYALRQSADIAAGAPSVTGRTADSLLHYVGDTLYTDAVTNPAGGGTGVFISNFNSNDVNSVVFTDNTGSQRTYPYTATLTLNFSDTLVNDPASEYWVYFTTLPGAGNDWGESGAVLVDDASNADMAGSITGSSITKTFNYDSNTQGGRTAGTDAAITVIGIGLTTGQYVRATGTITRSTSNSVSLVAPLERNYLNA